MHRRALLPLLGLPLATPALGQGVRRLPVVAFVGFATEAADAASVAALREGMRAHGYLDGQGFRLEHRHARSDMALAATIIRDLVALPADVFVTPGPAAARAVRRATAIPLVAVGLPPVASDPELFASLARPGGSVTGFASFGEEMSAKRVELLREAIPGLALIGVLHNATDPTFDAWGRLTEASAAAQGVVTRRVPLHSASVEDLAAALRAFGAEGGRAIVVVRDFLTHSLDHDIVRLATAEGIAVIADGAQFARAGGLFSYGASLPDLFRRAAGYVVRILRGERPGDLPVQLPVAIEFVVNLRGARALGLVMPDSILARAEEVIE
jgi:putative ABC transport system substrate-binding protein